MCECVHHVYLSEFMFYVNIWKEWEKNGERKIIIINFQSWLSLSLFFDKVNGKYKNEPRWIVRIILFLFRLKNILAILKHFFLLIELVRVFNVFFFVINSSRKKASKSGILADSKKNSLFFPLSHTLTCTQFINLIIKWWFFLWKKLLIEHTHHTPTTKPQSNNEISCQTSSSSNNKLSKNQKTRKKIENWFNNHHYSIIAWFIFVIFDLFRFLILDFFLISWFSRSIHSMY